MPTYDYECPDCQHRFQRFHSMTADPIKVCPTCEKENVKRLIGAGAGLIFKGSGFYITDYRSKSYNDSKSKAEGSKDCGGSKDSGSANASSGSKDSGASSSSASTSPSSTSSSSSSSSSSASSS